jgi:hypothetical protein
MKHTKAFVAIALIIACDGGAPVEPTKPIEPAAIQLTSVDTLRPGQTAQVRGSGLTNLKSLLVDGVAATELVVRSDNVADFRVPAMRACETDMRKVKVSVAGSAQVDGIVRVEPKLSLRPGESRVLTQDDLQCLRLPALDEDYVLSAANLTIPTAEMEFQRPLLSVRVRGTDEAATASPVASLSPGVTSTLLETSINQRAALAGNYAQAPTPFDPRYATAVVGDTLRFVDWFAGPAETICQMSPQTVPNFKAKVLAISGNVVVVVDTRNSYAPMFADTSKLGWLRDAAAMTDRLLLPTMRSIFDADYQPPAGGGGRFFLLVGNLPNGAGFAYDGPLGTANIFSQVDCARSSEMVVSTISAGWLAAPQNQHAGLAAGVFLHEYAHNADFITSRRGRTQSILNEGLATLAEETASRIASGQLIGARHAAVGINAPVVTGGALGMWGTQPAVGPWQFNGRYGMNARMLLFLRELAGEASVDHGRRPTLYQRLIYAPIDWLNRPVVIGHITTTLGISYNDLTDRFMLASVTAGLIDPGVAHDLPRYTAWDHSERARVTGPLSPGFTGRASRRVTAEYTLGAADGGHAALYLMGDGLRGVSLEFVSVAPTARIVRLTRLR